MTRAKDDADIPRTFATDQLAALLESLARRGYDVIGPTVRDGAIVLDHIDSCEQLPIGWTDEQTPGHYRLSKCDEQGFFGYATGPHSWKRYLHPAEVKLWSAERQNGSFRILNNEVRPQKPYAFVGVRPCDLAAIKIQDRVLIEDRYRDGIYSNRRKDAFLVVVQCTRAVETCFCKAVRTGPKANAGFDLALTELISPRGHHFIAHAGSRRGLELLSEIETKPATVEQLRQENEAIEAAAKSQTRSMDPDKVEELLYRNFDSPQWEKVMGRCLTCANCTMVCPTCFCTTIEDASDLSGNHAERWRRWDSCFTLSFSYIHGGSVRASAKARYRQWITHKLSAWIHQFGTLGCVGCGRCISWCPVGIDLTEAVRGLQEGKNHGNP